MTCSSETAQCLRGTYFPPSQGQIVGQASIATLPGLLLTPKEEVVFSSKMLGSLQTTQLRNPEDCALQYHEAVPFKI
jgi:hypothetical protein